MERKLNIKVLLPEEVIEKYDIDEDTGVLSYIDKRSPTDTGKPKNTAKLKPAVSGGCVASGEAAGKPPTDS